MNFKLDFTMACVESSIATFSSFFFPSLNIVANLVWRERWQRCDENIEIKGSYQRRRGSSKWEVKHLKILLCASTMNSLKHQTKKVVTKRCYFSSTHWLKITINVSKWTKYPHYLYISWLIWHWNSNIILTNQHWFDMKIWMFFRSQMRLLQVIFY